ncbi:MAG: hypothetical protein UFJ02_05220 [Prevotella sp.]|nr:hypothetical protein [Prevotella sp.]
MRHFIITIGLLVASCSIPSRAQVTISEQATSTTDFPLCANGKACEIYVAPGDYEVVNKITYHLFIRNSLLAVK